LSVIALQQPTFTLPPQPCSCAVGSEVSISCEVSGVPAPNVKWLLGDVEVVPSDTVKITVTENQRCHRLSITGATPELSGTVKAVAENVCGRTVAETTVRVAGSAPSFVSKPIKCTVLTGEYLLLFR